MFKDIEKNITMLKGAYRKLKRYYYYNKNFVMLRKKIAAFEYDHEKMEDIFSKLAEVLAHPKKKTSRDYIDSLIDNIDFYVLPKNLRRSRLRLTLRFPIQYTAIKGWFQLIFLSTRQ